jgi:hypothetical protein
VIFNIFLNLQTTICIPQTACNSLPSKINHYVRKDIKNKCKVWQWCAHINPHIRPIHINNILLFHICRSTLLIMIQRSTMVKLKVTIIAWYFNFAVFLPFELKIINSEGRKLLENGNLRYEL